MKNYLFFRNEMRMGKCIYTFCLFFFLSIVTSCQQGFDDKEQFSTDVSGVTLESPDASKITFVKASGTTSVVITWPLVVGAGGYQFSLYIVDDPDNPVAVGEENQILDRCSAVREYLEETKYLVSIKTMGNEKYNNKGSLVASESSWSTYIPATMIPDGTDLSDFFATNPITGEETETAYELVGGGSYTVLANIDFDAKNVIIRGDKMNHAKITISANKFISKGGGLEFRYIDFDLSGKADELINYGDPSDQIIKQGDNNYAVASPVVFESCNFSGMTYRIISSSSTQNFFMSSLSISNCVFSMKLSSAFIQFAGTAYIKDFTIKNTTFNNQKGASTSQRFLQYGNGNIAKSGVTAASLNLLNNTFFNVSYSQNMANYNMMRQNTYTVTAKRNIFVDCGNKQVIHQLAGGNTTIKRECDQNAYWYDGAFPQTEITNSAGDKSETHFEVDPGFANPDAGDFTISAPQLIAAGIGDPRWFTVQ